MTCPICKHGKMDKGTTTLIFETDNSTIVIKDVPANVCDNCQEAFISEEISKELLVMAHKEEEEGMEIEVLHYAA